MKISITCHGDMVLYSESTTVENVFESCIPDHRATFKRTRYSDGLPVSTYTNDEDEVVITLEYEEGGSGSSICINCFNVLCDIEMDDDSDFDSENSATMLDRYQIELISTEDEASFFADDECAACTTIEFGTRYPVRYYA